MSTRFCTACGAQLAGTSFCTSCGAKSTALTTPEPNSRPVASKSRQLRCVECSAPIDAGLVCARCASMVVPAQHAPAPAASPSTPTMTFVPPAPEPTPIGLTREDFKLDSEPQWGFLWAVLAGSSLIALVFTLQNASPFIVVIAGVGVGLAVLVALVVAAIWGRPSAQAMFYMLTTLVFGALCWCRLRATPALGIVYENQGEYAFVTFLDPAGSLGREGIQAPVWISSVDGTLVGEGRAELGDLIAEKRVFDKCRLRLWNGQTLPRDVDVVILDR